MSDPTPNSFEQEIKAWADERFGDRDLPNRIRKLGEELGELAEAIARNDQRQIITEAADVGIVTTDLLAILGVSLQAAMEAKMEFNRNRTLTYKEQKR